MKLQKICLTLMSIFLGSSFINSCTVQPANMEYTGIESALKIGIYAYDEATKTSSFETLTLNEPEILMPMGMEYNGLAMTNFNINFSYEGGICKIISEEKDIQLSVGPNGGIWEHGQPYNVRTFGYEMTVAGGDYVAVNPYGSGHGDFFLNNEDELLEQNVEPYVGREYWLTVNACDFDGTPIIRAKLKLVQLEEKESPRIAGMLTDGFYSIELVAYEYSDAYKIMGGEN